MFPSKMHIDLALYGWPWKSLILTDEDIRPVGMGKNSFHFLIFIKNNFLCKIKAVSNMAHQVFF